MTYRCGVRMRGRVGRGATAFVAAVVLAGCGGSTDPTPTTPAPTSPTVTATPEPSEEPTESPEPTETGDPVGLPPLPEAAKENTPEGAEAFIRYYFDVANSLYENPPSEIPISDMIEEDCISCQTLISEVTGLRSAGQRTTGPLYAIESMKPIGGGLPGVQNFNMTMKVLDVVVETIATGETETVKGHSVSGVGAAMWEGGQWRVYGMALE